MDRAQQERGGGDPLARVVRQHKLWRPKMARWYRHIVSMHFSTSGSVGTAQLALHILDGFMSKTAHRAMARKDTNAKVFYQLVSMTSLYIATKLSHEKRALLTKRGSEADENSEGTDPFARTLLRVSTAIFEWKDMKRMEVYMCDTLGMSCLMQMLARARRNYSGPFIEEAPLCHQRLCRVVSSDSL
jgi:hypothetical protein